MSLSTRVLIALAAGIALGLALSTTRAPAALDFIDVDGACDLRTNDPA